MYFSDLELVIQDRVAYKSKYESKYERLMLILEGSATTVDYGRVLQFRYI